MDEKDQVCPRCGGTNISVEINQETNDASVIMGNFAPPFYMFCHNCKHKWYLVDKDNLEQNGEKQTQRTRGLWILLITQVVPWLILLIILVLFALNMKTN